MEYKSDSNHIAEKLLTKVSFGIVIGLSLIVLLFLVFISVHINSVNSQIPSESNGKSLLDSSTLNDYIVQLNTANASVDAGEYEEAVEAYKEAIEIAPNEESAYIGLANAYRYLGELEKARQIIKEAHEKLGSESLKSYLQELSENSIS